MMKLAYQEALTDNACSSLMELQKEAGLLSWNKAGENEFTFACHLANKLDIEVQWEPFNEYTISASPNITLATLAIKARLQLQIQAKGEQVQVRCLSIDATGFLITSTDQGEEYRLQIDGQAKSPGLPSMREAITTTYRAAIWLAQLPGFPPARPAEEDSDGSSAQETPSGEESDEVTDLTLQDDQEDETSEDEQGSQDMPRRGGIGLKTTRLNDGCHRVVATTPGSASAAEGEIRIGEEITSIDNIDLMHLPMESVLVLLSGPPGVDVSLSMVSLGGVRHEVIVTRTATDKPGISWSRAVLPLRERRRELEKKRPPKETPGSQDQEPPEARELRELQQGESVFLKVRRTLMKSSFTSFDKIPRVHSSVNSSRFYIPKVEGVTRKEEMALGTWLSWLSKDKKSTAKLELKKAKAPLLRTIPWEGAPRPKRERAVAKALRELAQLSSGIRQHAHPVVRDSSLHRDLQTILEGSQALTDTCMNDGTPLQEDEVGSVILDAITEVLKHARIMAAKVEGGLDTAPQVRAAVNEMARRAKLAIAIFSDSEAAITSAADKRATISSLLNGLAKKCKSRPHRKHAIKIWWDNAQGGLPAETDAARLEAKEALNKEVEDCWERPDWLHKIRQHALQYGHALTERHTLPKLRPKRSSNRGDGTAYIDMQKVGCALIQKVRGARQSLPAGFTRKEPAPPAHLRLIMLAELLRDLSYPTSREDLERVGSDIRLILAAEGDLAVKEAFFHSDLARKRQVGRSKFSPMQAFNEALGEWEARNGDRRPPTGCSTRQGPAAEAASTQVATETTLREAWHRLRQRKQEAPDPLPPGHWLEPRWLLLKTLVDKLQLPIYGWSKVKGDGGLHHSGTQYTTGTHTTYTPPEDHRDKERLTLDSQAEVLKWTRDFPREDTDREDNTGLEFECQLNTPTLSRLHQLRSLGRTNPMALRRTMLDKQDLIRMGADDFAEDGYYTTRGEWWVRARGEECTRTCVQCGRAWSSKQIDPEGWCASCKGEKPEDADRNDLATAQYISLLVRSALPEELNSMASGGDVKETVMTIPFLMSCITNMIQDLERKHITGAQKRRATQIPEAPWKWFTSSELGFPLVDDKYVRSIHPLVETFLDDQLETHLPREEEADAPHSPLIAMMRTMKEGWGNLEEATLAPVAEKATTRERFSTSHIARNPLKLPDLELNDENFLSMIKHPPSIGAVRIHMDPVSIDTSFGGITADTFQGVATLITPSGPFKVEGARWHFLKQVFSSPENMKTDLNRERLLQEEMDNNHNGRSFPWKILRLARRAVKADSYVGDTALTAPPFLDNASRGDTLLWGKKTAGPQVINWTGLSNADRKALCPKLRDTNNWILLSLAGKESPSSNKAFLEHSTKAMTTNGKSFRKRKWWLLGDDELAKYDRRAEVWVSRRHNIPKELLDNLESELNSDDAKDIPHHETQGTEGKYWAGTEAGLMGIASFPGLIYATDGSQEKKNMGAGFYMHNDATGGFYRVGRYEEGSSSNRAEHAAACIALEHAIRFAESKRPLILLTDSKCLLMAIQKWLGEGIDPIIKTSPDGDILREILELLRNRIKLGLFTLFVKIKSHRGEFFNEMADRWADKGRDTDLVARWTSLRQRPIFLWTASGKDHRSTVSKVVKTRAHLMAARLQIPEHDNHTARFLKREGNSRAVLGEHWKDKRVSVKSKRRLLQSISFQFPCAANFKKWGWQDEDECRLCKALFPGQPAFSECLGHIQGYCKALQKPRIAVHHGIWRDLIMHISRQSLEENEDGSRAWSFPTSVSAVKHEEWEMRNILTHMGLMTNDKAGRMAVGRLITEFHCEMGYWDANENNDLKPEAFLTVRPDGVAFRMQTKLCAFLEFIRPMDSRDGASEQPDWYTGADWTLDWAQDKDLEKLPDTLVTLNLSGGYRNEQRTPGPQPNITSQWGPEAQRSKPLGTTDSRN